MRNKRGFFMALYLVMLTLLMCGVVMVSSVSHQKGVSVSLVSPSAVLESRADLEIFEMRERELILSSLDDVDFDADLFKEKFVSGLNMEMKDFIFDRLFWKGQEMKGDFDKDTFLRNVLYDVSEDSGNLVLRRSRIAKRFSLSGEGDARISFPVDVEHDFSAEYLIKKNGDGFSVERVLS